MTLLHRGALVAEVIRIIQNVRHDIGRGGPCQPGIDQVLENAAARLELLIAVEPRRAIAKRILARLQDPSEPDPLAAVEAVLEDEGVV